MFTNRSPLLTTMALVSTFFFRKGYSFNAMILIITLLLIVVNTCLTGVHFSILIPFLYEKHPGILVRDALHVKIFVITGVNYNSFVLANSCLYCI